jgi:hypothetical protein
MKTVDLTPVGCSTPEGIARVNRAVDAMHGANAGCVNALRELLDALDVLASMRPLGEEMTEAQAEARAAMRQQIVAQDEFLRALAGRPAARKGGAL